MYVRSLYRYLNWKLARCLSFLGALVWSKTSLFSFLYHQIRGPIVRINKQKPNKTLIHWGFIVRPAKSLLLILTWARLLEINLRWLLNQLNWLVTSALDWKNSQLFLTILSHILKKDCAEDTDPERYSFFLPEGRKETRFISQLGIGVGKGLRTSQINKQRR